MVHSRTYHRFTKPLRTYGSDFANFSATSGESPLNSKQDCAINWAGQRASKDNLATVARCPSFLKVRLAKFGAAFNVVVDYFVEQ